MSKVNAKKNSAPAKTQKPASDKNNTVKKKKKFWFDTKAKKKKPTPPPAPAPAPSNQGKAHPPKDAQQYSANWKILQEVRDVSVCE